MLWVCASVVSRHRYSYTYRNNLPTSCACCIRTPVRRLNDTHISRLIDSPVGRTLSPTFRHRPGVAGTSRHYCDSTTRPSDARRAYQSLVYFLTYHFQSLTSPAVLSITVCVLPDVLSYSPFMFSAVSKCLWVLRVRSSALTIDTSTSLYPWYGEARMQK